MNHRSLLKKITNLGHSHHHPMTLEDTTEEGIRVVIISFIALMVTAVLQVIVVFFTGSVGLLADTVHNFSDAFTSVPLWIAFRLSQRKRSKQYSYGYGRAEDLAGLFIVIMIAGSAILIFVESIERLINPKPLSNLFLLGMASIIGFLGNELVAQYRIRSGSKIHSQALIADGLHSRADGFTSLAILIGVVGAYFGFPQLDAIVGVLIGFIILVILRDAAKSVFLRLMDGVDPRLLDEIREISLTFSQVKDIHELRARWSGRAIFAEMHVEIDKLTSIGQSHDLIQKIEDKLKTNIKNMATINIHLDPINEQEDSLDIT